MKLKLTESAELELKAIHQRIEEDERAWDKLSKHELLVVDAELYVEDGYIENEFDDFNEWCKEVALEEYLPAYVEKHPWIARRKINRLINKGLMVIVS